MGTYSQLEEYLTIREDKVEELSEKIIELYKEWETSKEYRLEKEWIGYWLYDCRISKDRHLRRDEYYGKFYNGLGFVKFIKDYLDEGEHFLILTDDIGEKGGYRIYVENGVPSVYGVYFKEILGQEIDFDE